MKHSWHLGVVAAPGLGLRRKPSTGRRPGPVTTPTLSVQALPLHWYGLMQLDLSVIALVALF
ncbi:MAG: hypothetical protein K9N62_08225 [Verrucomicrobia bacterium]|nr:hypothetical protein [Verrucomicrobiota bacterium]